MESFFNEAEQVRCRTSLNPPALLPQHMTQLSRPHSASSLPRSSSSASSMSACSSTLSSRMGSSQTGCTCSFPEVGKHSGRLSSTSLVERKPPNPALQGAA